MIVRKISVKRLFFYVSIYVCVHSNQQDMGGVIDLDTRSFSLKILIKFMSMSRSSYLRVFPINIVFDNILNNNR